MRILRHSEFKEKRLKAYWKNDDTIISSNGNVAVNNKIKSIIRKLDLNISDFEVFIDQLYTSHNKIPLSIRITYFPKKLVWNDFTAGIAKCTLRLI